MPISEENTVENRLVGVESLLAGLDQKAGPLDVRAKQQAAVLAFGRRTSAQPPLNVLLEDAAAMIAEVLQLDRIGVGQVVPSGSGLAFRIATLAKQSVLTDVLHHQYSLDPACSMAAYTLQAAAPVSTPNLSEETQFTDLFLRNMRVSGALMLPLIVTGKPFGVLGVFAREKRSFTVEDIQFAETITYLLISSLGRIQAEEELQQQQSLAQSVLEMIDAFVVTLDHEGRILHINPTLQKIAGFRLEEVEQRPFWDVFVTPEQVELIRTLFREARNDPTPIEFESHLLDKYGQKRRVCWTLKYLTEGNEQRMILCGLDQTETIQLKEELRKVYQHSQQTTRVIQELCSELGNNTTFLSPKILALLQDLAKPIEPPTHLFHPLRSLIPDEQRQFVRRIYRYRQKIAPYSEGKFPRPEEFIEVQCKDISAGGIAFFMEKEVPFRRLVVSLGQGRTASYFLAEVVRSTQVDHQGQKLYQIGCKFCGRITPPSDFNLTASSQ